MHPLRAKRRAAVMTQQELADASGVARNTILSIELDGQSPTPKTIRALALALGCEPRELLAPEATKPVGEGHGDDHLPQLRQA